MNQKKIAPAPIAGMVLLITILMTGCTSVDESDHSDNRAQVEAGVWAFHSADTSRSAEGVIDLLWPEFTMMVDGNQMTYEDAVEGARGFMPSLEVFHTNWTQLQITLLGADHAISSFNFRDSIVTKTGDLIHSWGPNSFVWEKRNGQWKVLYTDADHYPIDAE